MHAAYEVSNLINHAEVQIESIAAFDNNLLLGTRQGHLMMYSMSTGNDNNQKYESQILHYCKNFSKKPIQQIEVLPEDNLLLCLTDSVISTHSITARNFPLVKTLEQTKGASLFALDNKPTTSLTGESSSVLRLCVAVRRKLQLFYGKNGEFKQHLFDFNIPDVPKIMAWGQQFLCVGFKAEYVLYDLSSGKPKELFPISSSRSLEPTIAKYSETSFLLGREQTSVFIEEAKDENNAYKIDIKQTIKWKDAPTCVVWDEPYVLGLLQEKVIVQTVAPERFIQTLSEPNRARLMYRCRRGLIYVASVSQVWCLSAVDVTKQIEQLLKDKQFQIAMDLTSIEDCSEEERRQKIHSIQTLNALDLFDAKKYTLSMKEFMKLNTDPARVIKLIPELDGKENDSSTRLKGKDLEDALNALTEYLLDLRNKLKIEISAKEVEEESEKERKNAPGYGAQDGAALDKAPGYGAQGGAALDKAPGYGAQDGAALDKAPGYGAQVGAALDKAPGYGAQGGAALDKAPGYGAQDGAALDKKRKEDQRKITQQFELIDTTLLKCYLQTNDAFVAPLLRRNNCRLEEAERTLLHHGKLIELIILYQTKGQHTKALQLLRDQAKQPDSSLEGYRDTKNYLQHLGAEHINLIFKFSDWILKEHPEEGLKIFTEDITEVEHLPRPKILDFLLREHGSLVIPYLEHVIHAWNDTNTIFHDALINMYREKITSKSYVTEEELQHVKSKLVAFLEKSTQYTPERVLLHFPTDSLFEERAIVLGKLGRHEQALAIYILILGDVERSLRYCENVYSTDPKNQDVYVTLMRILMNPENAGALGGPLANVPRHADTAKPDLEAALGILEKHADKISPLKALSVLPDSVPLSRLKHFLESALDSQLTLKRRMQILKGLLYAEHVQVRNIKQYHESKSVVINDYDVCPVCKKRFNNQSAFVRYPSGEIVHYSCRLDKS